MTSCIGRENSSWRGIGCSDRLIDGKGGAGAPAVDCAVPRPVRPRRGRWRGAVAQRDSVSLHSLRHSHITHLIEDGYDPLFAQQQVGHCYASTTAPYTSVSSDFRNRTLWAELDRSIQAALGFLMLTITGRFATSAEKPLRAKTVTSGIGLPRYAYRGPSCTAKPGLISGR